MANTFNNSGRADEFVRLLTANHGKIYAYIYTLVPHLADAEDIMQQVSSVMFNRFDDFESGTNFTAWGKKIAFYEILGFRRKQASMPLHFSESTLIAIADHVSSCGDEADRRIEVLERCVQKLANSDKELVVMHYSDGKTARGLAERLGVSIHKVYRSMERIHSVLLRCVRRTLVQEGI